MALQKELIALVSAGLGVAAETVTIMDRELLEAGMRTRSLRGRAKTPMTYRDAANLIIAAAWNRSPKDTVRIVGDYGDLKQTTKGDDTLGEALERLLKLVAQRREDFRSGEAEATVTLFGPKPYADIEVLLPGGAINRHMFGDQQGQLSQVVVRRVDLRAGSFLAIAESVADGLQDTTDRDAMQAQ